MDDQQNTSPYTPHTPPPLPPQPPQPQPQRRGPGAGLTIFQSCLLSGCVTLLVPVLLLLGFFGLMYALISPAVAEATRSIDSIGSSTASLNEKVLRPGAEGAGIIVLVKIHGAIDGNGSPLDGSGMMAKVSEELKNAGENERVRAVLLQIDSPGGGLTASDMIYHEVLKLREKNIKVAAWAAGAMASGGYYVAAAAERITASPTATVGSIGVILQHIQVQSLMEKLGVKVSPITSGEHKDIGSMFREMTPEERKLLQDFINASYRRFVDIVAKGRNMPTAEVEKLADGSVFTADEAVANGLIDQVGYVEDALALLEESLGESDMRVVSYWRMPTFGELIRGAGAEMSAAAVRAAAEEQNSPKPMAVW